MASAPEQSNAIQYNYQYYDDKGEPVLSGASPLTSGVLMVDKQGQLVYPWFNYGAGKQELLKDRIVHVISNASPETRQQGDFTLSYDWDDAVVSVGGGISTEPDYESRFANLGVRMDFDQKQTTLDIGLSYTNGDTNARIYNQVDDFYSWTNRYQNNIKFDKNTGQNNVCGTRQNWATHLNLTQVINQDAIFKLGMTYTRNTGYLGNPYKYSVIYNVASKSDAGDFFSYFDGKVLLEQRPDERNLWQWQTGWVQHISALDAALHFDYSFAHDD